MFSFGKAISLVQPERAVPISHSKLRFILKKYQESFKRNPNRVPKFSKSERKTTSNYMRIPLQLSFKDDCLSLISYTFTVSGDAHFDAFD
jgi:hypothetical protein